MAGKQFRFMIQNNFTYYFVSNTFFRPSEFLKNIQENVYFFLAFFIAVENIDFMRDPLRYF